MKISKYEAREFRRKKLEYDLRGKGLYVFRNASSTANLMLPKPDANGRKDIGPGQEFQGDDYFMALVRTNEARLVRTLVPVEQEKTMTEKLILDQPETVTTEGTVERVVEIEQEVKLNETPAEEQSQPEVLINEDPMEGVVID